MVGHPLFRTKLTAWRPLAVHFAAFPPPRLKFEEDNAVARQGGCERSGSKCSRPNDNHAIRLSPPQVNTCPTNSLTASLGL
jgi:hypothetical protein